MAPRKPLHCLIAGLLILLLSSVVMPAAAQSTCGPTLVVEPGDTLARIAGRCGTTVEAILTANPQITNPSLIYAGQTINIPDSVEALQPRVVAFPVSGPPGTAVEVVANGFPVNTSIEIGIGRPNAAYAVLQTAPTNDRGGLRTTITVPSSFGPSDPWVIVASTVDRTLGAVTGGAAPVVAIMPLNGQPGSAVSLIANGLPPNQPVNIGIGPPQSEYSIIASAQTNERGALQTQVIVPGSAGAGDRLVFVVDAPSFQTGGVSAPFLVGPVPPAPPPPVSQPTLSIAPQSGPPGTPLRVTAGGFPANSALALGLGPLNSEYVVTYYVGSNAQGALDVVVQIPTYAGANQTWAAVLQTRAGQQVQAVSGGFNVTSPGGTPPVEQPPDQARFTTATTYLIALNDQGQSGQYVGCGDSLIPITVQFPETVAPLTSSLQQLFAIGSQYYGQSGLYNPFYQSSLQVQGISINNGHATINLGGSLVFGGTCDAPRVQEILRQTATQYSTIDSVTININGAPLEQLLSGQG